MMRLAWVILALAALAATVVHLRARQANLQVQMHRMEAERIALRRRLQDQKLQLDCLETPQRLLWRARAWPLEIVAPDGSTLADDLAVQSSQ